MHLINKIYNGISFYEIPGCPGYVLKYLHVNFKKYLFSGIFVRVYKIYFYEALFIAEQTFHGAALAKDRRG